MQSLFGEEFAINFDNQKEKAIIKKATKAKDKPAEVDAVKILKSKKLTLEERLNVIKINVLKTLGKQKDNVLVIKDRETFHNYITEAIKSGRIAIDTETNNSTDCFTCQLMGLCLYYKNAKQVYIPINHRDFKTKERFSWQLTEEDCREELQRIVDNNTFVVMHNGKFDYEVLKCTCGIDVIPSWDTMICARLLNENEPAALKWQFVNKIDKTQEKYSIDKLFENIAYADVDPEIFALYAATDSYITDKLYEIQAVELEKPEYGPHMDLLGTHMLKGLRWLFYNVEMPITVITANMELTGVAVDKELGARLKDKYNEQLNVCDDRINGIIAALKPIITKWRLEPASNEKIKIYASKKSKMTKEKLEATYPNEDSFGRYKLGKAPVEILEDPINLSSAQQLAVLFYDILGVNKPVNSIEVDVDNSKKISEHERKTGKDELKAIKEKLINYAPKLEELETEFDEEDLVEEIEDAMEFTTDKEITLKLGSAAKLADLILERRGIEKLITTYIDVIPELASHWPDGRVRFHMNSAGADTGRYTSGGKWHWLDENGNSINTSGLNIQNIPSRGNGKITRLLFKADTKYHKVETTSDYFTVPETDEVETSNGWKQVEDLKIGDIIIGDDTKETISNIIKQGTNYLLYTNVVNKFSFL